MGDKQNDVVIVNPEKIYNQKYIYATMYVNIYDTHMYTHMLTKYKTRNSL